MNVIQEKDYLIELNTRIRLRLSISGCHWLMPGKTLLNVCNGLESESRTPFGKIHETNTLADEQKRRTTGKHKNTHISQLCWQHKSTSLLSDFKLTTRVGSEVPDARAQTRPII